MATEISSDIGISSGKLDGFSIDSDSFNEVLSFLDLKDLARLERVSKRWKKQIDGQWKNQYQMQFGIIRETDLKRYFPDSIPSFKKIVLSLLSSRVFGREVYQRYLGNIGLVPPIPKEISLKKLWTAADPADSDKMIGDEYVWVYCPPYIELDSNDFSLDGPDDPNCLEAPRLVQNGVLKKIAAGFRRKFGVAERSGVLRVPVTVNNLGVLFRHLKNDNPPIRNWCEMPIQLEHGNKRAPVGWFCVRRRVVGKNLTFADQQALAGEKNVVISKLAHRMLFSFLEQACSKDTGIDPDQHVIARTSTLLSARAVNEWNIRSQGLESMHLVVRRANEVPIGVLNDRSSLGVQDAFVRAARNIGVAVELPQRD